MADAHSDDVMALVRRLADLRHDCGVLETRIEWHLHLHDLADLRLPAPAPEPVRAPVLAMAARRHWPKGTLEDAILDGLTEARTPTEIADAIGARSESVRVTVKKLEARGLVVRHGKRYLRAAGSAAS